MAIDQAKPADSSISVTIGDMKILDGRELAGFIKERQARQVRALRQTHHLEPKLAIVVTIEHPAIDVYMRMKTKYGADILIDVDIHRVAQADVLRLIDQLNMDETVQGIIVQLPLEDQAETDTIVNAVAPNKDVDGLGKDFMYDPATPMAILWLLAGYNIDLKGKKVVLIGRGKLVGAPLERIFHSSGIDVSVVDRQIKDIKASCLEADVLITATGVPGLVTADMIKPNAVVVDAGVAGEQGKTVGDLAIEVYDRTDLTITPKKGGVGPLTICSLFDNVIRAARATSKI